MAVWKFPLAATGSIEYVDMPQRSEIVHAHEQRDTVAVWAIVDPTEELHETRRLVVLSTGVARSYDQMAYIGTAHLHDGQIVVHVFEVFGT